MGEEIINGFRTSAFGGYKKDDVLKYIEISAAKKQEEINSLKSELNALTKKNEEETANKQTLENEKEELFAKLSEKSDVIAALQNKIDLLEAANSELSEITEEYKKLKEKLSGIELSAYKRAGEIEQEARLNAMRIKKETEEYIATARNTFTPVIEAAEDELKNAGQALDNYKERMNLLVTGARGLREQLINATAVSGITEFKADAKTEETAELPAPDAEQQPGIVKNIIDRLKNQYES